MVLVSALQALQSSNRAHQVAVVNRLNIECGGAGAGVTHEGLDIGQRQVVVAQQLGRKGPAASVRAATLQTRTLVTSSDPLGGGTS